MNSIFKENFLKRDTTNWSYKVYEIIENFNDTIPSYCIDNTPGLHNEALVKKTKLTMKEIEDVVKKLKLT